ncbi:hypothetical protein GCM10020220_051400 [Nonomuraea rubra]
MAVDLLLGHRRWILLLSFLFAATNVDELNNQAGFVGAIFETALSSPLAHGISRSPRSASSSAG